MFGTESLAVNAQGHLTLGGMDVPALAQKYGTPLMLMDEGWIRKTASAYHDAIRKHYGENADVSYASKAFSTGYMYKIMAETGLCADVVSGGELYTARAAGFPMNRVFLHGNNKTPDEIILALESGIGHFVSDNLTELALINALAAERGLTADIMLRVKPGVEAHTHDFVKTGQIDSKFGVAIETGEALDAIGEILKLSNLRYVGIHCHIGSQIFETAPFGEAARVMINFMAAIRDRYGVDTAELNLGGGFGVRYTEEDAPRTVEENVGMLCAAVKAELAARNLPAPRLLIEPGRSMVAPAGITVYTVGSVKTIPGIRTYVSIDGGMTDNPRYILYGSKYEFLLPEYAAEPRTQVVTIAGRNCESGDLLGEHVEIQPVKAGDLLCTLTTGAYNYSMASNYNRVPRPAVVMVRDGKDKVVVRRETYEDLIRNDIF
ncbi:MAG: diaminopimelate decarboxylase [Clostridia bacterium]|nr:diaminopimelate decarboxylase [Clostridia bacterium]